MYGGLQSALGIYALLALVRPHLVRSLLVTLVLVCAGLALGRLGGVAFDGGVSGYTIGALSFEIVATFVAFFFLSRMPATAA
jgi:hypothetical protein